ncbi:chromobox protein homolog 7-like, partial [Rhincodon typus]|uniref:chromobox protein homolog 7-like n=1 Tax=Rhincodon typus TaxID=259920 RepID=UPI00202EB73D
EQRDRALGHRKRGPKPKRYLLQRIYGMDLRSAAKLKEKGKLHLSLSRQFDGTSVSSLGQREHGENGKRIQFSLSRKHKFFKLAKPGCAQEPSEIAERHRASECSEDDTGRELSEKFADSEFEDELQSESCPEATEGSASPVQTTGSIPTGWHPSVPLGNITVTDVTANSLTVTFREGQAAEGFFRDRSLSC